jgi:hypothetical protein
MLAGHAPRGVARQLYNRRDDDVRIEEATTFCLGKRFGGHTGERCAAKRHRVDSDAGPVELLRPDLSFGFQCRFPTSGI